MLIVYLVWLSLFSSPVSAATFTYLTDPYGSVPVYYAATTTSSVTVHVLDAWDSGEGRYRRSDLKTLYSSDGDWYSTLIVQSAGTTFASGRRANSLTIMTGLGPGTTYTLSYNNNNRFCFNGHGHPVSDNPTGAYGGYTIRQATTDPNPPTSPTFSNITPIGATVNWTTNGNGAATRYKLYRGTSASGPWTTLYDGANLYYPDAGLAGNTTYYYRLGAYVPGGSEHYATILSITTATDPAVAAAQAAQSAAEASMIAAEQARTFAGDAKAGIEALQGEFSAFMHADATVPVIGIFSYAVPRATITSLQDAPYTLIATDNNSLQYRYKINDGAFTAWKEYTDETISVNLGAAAGIKLVTVQVTDSGNNIATAAAYIFKI
ncbi:MAG: fibronectin type III domain-containing protein [Clostridia bacterium]|nr:fibronectin type III domain-containing protein [Clostridia bacterium]